ncbi:MAG: metallophosphoesterase, partial [Bryobacteraceae bacterium]
MRPDRLFLALTALMLAASGGAKAAGRIDAWTQLTPQGTEIRAAVSGDACPTLRVDGEPLTMSLRATPDSDFPVRLCQALVPERAKAISLGGQAVPPPVIRPRRILIFGDTGCRLKGQAVQDCDNPRAWPFALVARHAAARRPDLVIHVGDYIYREAACPPDYSKDCGGSP